MTKKKLNWRLKELPNLEEIQGLVEQEIITAADAKELLFGEGKHKASISRDIKDLQKEVELLRELVLKLSQNHAPYIWPVIERYEYTRPWYQPYTVFCASAREATGLDNSDVTWSTSTCDTTNSATLTIATDLANLSDNS